MIHPHLLQEMNQERIKDMYRQVNHERLVQSIKSKPKSQINVLKTNIMKLFKFVHLHLRKVETATGFAEIKLNPEDA